MHRDSNVLSKLDAVLATSSDPDVISEDSVGVLDCSHFTALACVRDAYLRSGYFVVASNTSTPRKLATGSSKYSWGPVAGRPYQWPDIDPAIGLPLYATVWYPECCLALL